jgi:hypothetical protein
MELASEEQANKRSLSAEQAEDKKKLSTKEKLANASNEAMQKLETVKKIKKIKQTLRTINLISAVSIVGLIVTWAIMSVQVLVGNLGGVKEIELEGMEIGLWAILSFILLVILILVVIIIAATAYPWSVAISTIEDIGKWLSGN